MRPLSLSAAVLEGLFAEARACFPREACGVVVGPREAPEAQRFVAFENQQDKLHALDPEAHPRDARTAYAMNPLKLQRLVDGEEAQGGALVVVSPEIAATLDRHTIPVLGSGVAVKQTRGRIDLTHTGAVVSGPAAFAEAGVSHDDIDYVSIYDSFTITVLQTIEDLGFCEKGQGGRFVMDGALQAPHGRLPFNTDGGGLCNNHPSNRGGMTKVVEAVRQLRGEAHAAVQVPDCEIALAHGTGGSLATRMGSATLILGRGD